MPVTRLACIPPAKPTALSGTDDISFYCDDLAETLRELTSSGVEFAQEIKDSGFTRVNYFKVPGGFQIRLYRPAYTN